MSSLPTEHLRSESTATARLLIARESDSVSMSHPSVAFRFSSNEVSGNLWCQRIPGDRGWEIVLSFNKMTPALTHHR